MKAAHDAVAAGYDVLVPLTREPGDVGLGAAHVLAQMTDRAATVGPLVRGMLAAEGDDRRRSGLLLLLGQSEDRSPETLSALVGALGSGSDL